MPENETGEFHLKKYFKDNALKVSKVGKEHHFELLENETGEVVSTSKIVHLTQEVADKAWSELDFKLLDHAYYLITGKKQ